MLIVLPFINPPTQKINLEGTQIRTMKWSEVKAEGSGMPNFYGFELDYVFRKRTHKTDIDNTPFAVIDAKDPVLPVACYYGLIDLLTGHWKYLLKRTQVLGQSSLLSGTYPQPERRSVTVQLAGRIRRCLRLLSTTRRFRISIQRWASSYLRQDPLDSVLDCCSALESAYALPDELRLRLSFAAYHSVTKKKTQTFSRIYEMYGMRSKFIHGAETPAVSEGQQFGCIETVALVLASFVVLGKIPTAQVINDMILKDYSA